MVDMNNKKKNRSNFKFSMIGAKVGETIVFTGAVAIGALNGVYKAWERNGYWVVKKEKYV
jgi:hypothetical protein